MYTILSDADGPLVLKSSVWLAKQLFR